MTDTTKPGANKPATTKSDTVPIDDVLTDAVPADEALFETAADEAALTDAPALATEAPRPPRPRIRFGAIAWGLIVCAIASVVLMTVSDADARAGFIDWLFVVEPGEIVLLGVLGLGGFILLLALLGIIRGVQNAWGNRGR